LLLEGSPELKLKLSSFQLLLLLSSPELDLQLSSLQLSCPKRDILRLRS
jgi:hypothetical protein